MSEIPRNRKNCQQLLDAKYCSCLIAVMAHHRLWKTVRHLLPSLIWSDFIIQPPTSHSHFPLCSLTIQPFISHLHFFLLTVQWFAKLNSFKLFTVLFPDIFHWFYYHDWMALACISSQKVLYRISGTLLMFIFFLINRYIITTIVFQTIFYKPILKK